jgi:hypothetical protein
MIDLGGAFPNGYACIHAYCKLLSYPLSTADWWSKACTINKYFEPGCVQNLINSTYNPRFVLNIKKGQYNYII